MHRFFATVMITALAFCGLPTGLAADEPIGVQNVKVESILGREVRTVPDEDGGRVIDLLFDQHGNVRAAVVEFGGFLGIGTRKIAVDWSAFKLVSPQILVEVSREQLRKAPEFKAQERVFVVKPSQE